jgi:hypothetical protein
MRALGATGPILAVGFSSRAASTARGDFVLVHFLDDRGSVGAPGRIVVSSFPGQPRVR